MIHAEATLVGWKHARRGPLYIWAGQAVARDRGKHSSREEAMRWAQGLLSAAAASAAMVLVTVSWGGLGGNPNAGIPCRSGGKSGARRREHHVASARRTRLRRQGPGSQFEYAEEQGHEIFCPARVGFHHRPQGLYRYKQPCDRKCRRDPNHSQWRQGFLSRADRSRQEHGSRFAEDRCVEPLALCLLRQFGRHAGGRFSIGRRQSLRPRGHGDDGYRFRSSAGICTPVPSTTFSRSTPPSIRAVREGRRSI